MFGDDSNWPGLTSEGPNEHSLNFQLKLWRVHSTGIVPARDRPSPSESKPAKKYPHQDKETSIFHAKPCQVGQVNQVPGNYFARGKK